MAALADEVLIFELDWPGRDVWLSLLLEQTMFGSSNAGSRFFALARKLVQDNVRSPLHMDLAAVFLLAMELGFKGCWRSRQGQSQLNAIRLQLYQLAAPTPRPAHVEDGYQAGASAAFAQAYAYPLRGHRDERLAPLSPWRNLGIYGMAGYLLASALLWLALMYPFERYLGA
jgi:type VI secretion system protein ImpK